MIHYSCDRCNRVIDPAQEVRYVLKIDAQAMLEPADLDEPEGDRDHLLEINELLENMDLEESELYGEEEDVRQKRTFDLCPQCYRKYMRDPLGVETLVHVGFSHN